MRLKSYILATVFAVAPPTLSADSLSGAYLAARQADRSHDFAAAAEHYTRALTRAGADYALMEAAALAQMQRGRHSAALPIAQRIEEADVQSQIAHLIVATELARSGDFDALTAREEAGRSIGPLVDELLAAWALLGQGEVREALAAFDAAAQGPGQGGFANYHKAFALAMVGDFEGAEAIFASDAAGPLLMTRRGTMARAEILSQLDRNDDALRILDEAFGAGTDPALTTLTEALRAGERISFTHVPDATSGMAEVFYSLGAALSGEAQPDYALIYSRAAQVIRPDHTDAHLLTAELLTALDQHELALSAYAMVPPDHTDYHAAELGRVEALRALDRPDAAVEALNGLAKTHGDLAVVHSTLGDILRRERDFEGAVAAYDRALERTPAGARSEWFLHYARAISYERQDLWEQAEADFRRALELEPDQPQVLNYLGYSLVEKKIKLDEALDMIERAASARPDSGYIIDSLGWVLYRLGRYDEAVGHMERAIELMPIDPVVNDHLGDVYWAVGRIREAEFQWRRALSFIDPADPDGEADPERIRRKLEIGLDRVLQEEGAPPLQVADDDG